MKTLDMISESDITDFINTNGKEAIKEYIPVIKQNLDLVASKYMKVVTLILVMSSIYMLFAFQMTDTITLTFVQVNNPFLVEYLFPPVYLFFIFQLVILEEKLMEYASVIMSLLNKTSTVSEGLKPLLSLFIPYNFVIDVNQRLFSEKNPRKYRWSLLPVYGLAILPLLVSVYSLYRLLANFKNHPILITINFLICIWLVVSIVTILQHLFNRFDFMSLVDSFHDQGTILMTESTGNGEDVPTGDNQKK